MGCRKATGRNGEPSHLAGTEGLGMKASSQPQEAADSTFLLSFLLRSHEGIIWVCESLVSTLFPSQGKFNLDLVVANRL